MERKHINKRIIIKNNVLNNDDDDNNNNNVKRTKLSNNNNNNNNVHNNTSTMTTNDMILNLYLSDWECLQRGLATLRKFRNQLNSKKNNEEIYLKNVDSMITKKSTKAEDSLKNLNQ